MAPARKNHAGYVLCHFHKLPENLPAARSYLANGEARIIETGVYFAEIRVTSWHRDLHFAEIRATSWH